jgi:hypothetical protein
MILPVGRHVAPPEQLCELDGSQSVPGNAHVFVPLAVTTMLEQYVVSLQSAFEAHVVSQKLFSSEGASLRCASKHVSPSAQLSGFDVSQSKKRPRRQAQIV